MNEIPKELIESGNIHKQIRKYIQDEILPNAKGIKLIDLANKIENKIKELTEYDPTNPLKSGIAFPTGLSVNNCAAHWTPNPGDTFQILKEDDLIKIDYGVHLNGYITDGAFSFSFSDQYNPLIDASREATQVGIDMAGPDTWLGDIGSNIQETIESYEIELNGNTHSLKSIGNLCGHQIGRYQIHCGKPVPNVKNNFISGNEMYRMKEGEEYAIETFPTTGTGDVKEDNDIGNWSHFMANYFDKNKWNETVVKEGYSSKVNERFSTLAFCKRWLKDDNLWDSKKFKKIVKNGSYQQYPPLYDIDGSYVSQTEHTVFITSNGSVTLN